MSERNISISSNHYRGSVDSNMTTSSSSKSIPEVITRTTKGGRKLRYTLTVIQQPERARACGSGAKCMLVVFFHVEGQTIVPKTNMNLSICRSTSS